MFLNTRLSLSGVNISIAPIGESQLSGILKSLRNGADSVNELCFLLNSETELPIFLKLEVLETPNGQHDFSWTLFTFKPRLCGAGLIEIDSDWIIKDSSIFRSDQLAKLVLGYTFNEDIINSIECVVLDTTSGETYETKFNEILQINTGNVFENFFTTLGMNNFVEQAYDLDKKIQRLARNR